MKRGQAAGAAVLVAIIAVLLIGFIVLVEPSERAKILDEESSDSDIDVEDSQTLTTLLRERPGRIDYLAQREIEHPLPVVNVFTSTESKVIAEKNNAYISRSLFSKDESTFTFSVEEVDDTDNLLLAFEVVEASGRLLVTLNDEQVFNGEVDLGNPAPLTLPKSLLRRENVLLFQASSPGVAFWATHTMQLENIRVVADVIDRDAESASHIFLVSETEKRNLEKVVLRFQPACSFRDADMLVIAVNGQQLYQGIPDCDVAMVPIEFSPELVKSGENRISFSTEKGAYLLSHVLILSKLKEVDFPTYYFELSHEQFQDVQEDRRRLRLRLEFVDVTDTKYGEVVFNGHKYHFDTRELSEIIDVSKDVVQGSNAVKIKPQKTIHVRELRAELVR